MEISEVYVKKLRDLVHDAHAELLLAKKHLHEALHETVNGFSGHHTPESRREYAEMAEEEIKAAYDFLDEAIYLKDEVSEDEG